MFKNNTDRIAEGLIDLRHFWHNDQPPDQFAIAVKPDLVEQVVFTNFKTWVEKL